MKKYLLSIILLVTACFGANAQFAMDLSQISAGVKAGLNSSTVNADNVNSSSVTGYQAGLFARIGSELYFQTELYLSGTGGRFASINNAYNETVHFTDLNVPFLFGKEFGLKNFNFRVLTGFVYTSILNDHKSYSATFIKAHKNFGSYKQAALGFQAGAGVDIGKITADLRYEAGVVRVNDNYNQRQNLWALSLGYTIF